MTSAADFTSNLASLTISGVATELSEPPLSLSTSDLPAQWVQLPEIRDEIARTMARHGHLWGTITGQLIVALEAVGQGTQAVNWSATIAMMDNVWHALSLSDSLFAEGKITYSIRQGIANVAGNDYWAVIAEVTMKG